MSSSHQSTIIVLEQAKKNYHNLVTIYLTYFPISQNVSGKGSLSSRASKPIFHCNARPFALGPHVGLDLGSPKRVAGVGHANFMLFVSI